MTEPIKDFPNNGKEFTPAEGNTDKVHYPKQKDCPYETFSKGSKMRRSKDQARFFDNNGGDSKADGAGVIDHNAEYGPVTYGF